jgi:leader peptidase (prepilin peptidase)/N-methyltransferase
MLAFGKEIANTKLEEVHGDDPELGEEDPDAGVMGRRVPFGPFLALAALEWLLLRSQIQPLMQWLF